MSADREAPGTAPTSPARTDPVPRAGILAAALVRRLLPLERQRRYWLARAPDGPMRDYYASPFPERTLDVVDVTFVALDFETTGLDPERAEILSVGLVPIRGLSVVLAERDHRLVRPSLPVPAVSAVVHGILDDRAGRGESLRDVLPPLLETLRGRVLVAHHAGMEHRMLDRTCRALYGTPFVAPVVDTLALERRSLELRGQPIAGNALRLAALRERYHLPRYRAHDALVDAIATAELLLAQIAHRSAARRPTLAELLC